MSNGYQCIVRVPIENTRSRIATIDQFTRAKAKGKGKPMSDQREVLKTSPRPLPMEGGTTFQLEEATIDALHQAIRAGQTTCVQIVQHYIDRARAYNGVASLLVTEDGGPIPEVKGTMRACAPLRFPTETVNASALLPDLHRYKGLPL